MAIGRAPRLAPVALFCFLVEANHGHVLHVNCSGLPFEMALQAAVAQGLLNRHRGAHVWLSDLAEGLGAAGQKDGAGYPGTKFIEWKTGHAGGPWYQPASTCRTCQGLRDRWRQTAREASGQTFVPTSFENLMDAVRPLMSGRVLYAAAEMHALGPVLTMAGVEAAMPVTMQHDSFQALPMLLDTRGMWKDATAATVYTTSTLLRKTNKSAFVVQAPTCLPYLADVVVDYKLAMFWMPDMCSKATESTKAQHSAMEEFIEASGHFNMTTNLYYMGWYNRTRQPNPELLEECTSLHKLITLASDQSDNLSFLNKLRALFSDSQPLSQVPMWQGGQSCKYAASKAYIAIIISDGDNIAQDWSTLRPLLEERVRSGSKIPVSWTISNRWMQWGPAVLSWAYSQAHKTGVDSFLMGPSGYGYLFPGNMTRSEDKDAFALATITAARSLEMRGYVHWDVDLFLDNATTARTIDFLKRFVGSAISGAFMLGSDPLTGKWPDDQPYASPVFVKSVAAFKPIYQYGPPNATAAAAAINAVPPGSMVYVYLSLGDDMSIVDQIAELKSTNIELVGYRELIELARQKQSRERSWTLLV